MKLTYKEIVEDTKEYYSEDTSKRALSGQGCTYYDPKTKDCCAAGRYMKHPENFTIDKVGECGLDDIIYNQGFNFNDIMKEEVNNLNDNVFWEDLQWFHDCSGYWNTKGLSSQGYSKYQELLELADALDGKE